MNHHSKLDSSFHLFILIDDRTPRSTLQDLMLLFLPISFTLGPKGRNAIIDQAHGAPNVAAQLVKRIASKTNDTAGDGTTTATVLT